MNSLQKKIVHSTRASVASAVSEETTQDASRAQFASPQFILGIPRIDFLSLLLVSVSLRALLLVGQPAILWPDSHAYLSWGQRIADRFDFSNYPIFRTPLYPLFLSLFSVPRLSSESITSLVCAQHLLGVLSMFFVYRIGDQLFDRWTALLASVLFALNPLQLYYEHVVQTETLFVFFFTLFTDQALRFLECSTNRRGFWLGLIFALLILTRPIGKLLYIPLVISWFALSLMKRKGLQQKAILPLVYFFLSAILVVTPWLLVNLKNYGFFGLSKEFGLNLFHRVYDVDGLTQHDEELSPVVNGEVFRQRRKSKVVYFYVLHALQRRDFSAPEIDDMLGQAAGETLRANIQPYLANSLRFLVEYFYSPRESLTLCDIGSDRVFCSGAITKGLPPFYTQWMTRNVTALNWGASVIDLLKLIPIAVFSALAFLGALLAIRQKRALILFPLLLVGYFSVISSVLNSPEDRFHLPIDSLLFTFTAFAIISFISFLKKFVGKAW